MTASRLSISAVGYPVWVGHCRPWTSAIRSLYSGVSFPAVRSLTLLSLADPLLPHAWVTSGHLRAGNYPAGSRIFEAGESQRPEAWILGFDPTASSMESHISVRKLARIGEFIPCCSFCLVYTVTQPDCSLRAWSLAST